MTQKKSGNVFYAVFFAAGIGLYLASGAAWATFKSGEIQQASSDEQTNNKDSNQGGDSIEEDAVEVASPDLSPVDVVARQVESLQQSVENPDAMRVCYGFAAPKNREHIGGFQRFTLIANTPEYAGLIESERWMVGEPFITDGIALVTVTTFANDFGVTREPQVWAYRFILQMQEAEPYQGCWMTLAVENLMPANLGEIGDATRVERDLEI
ncbi:MAG: hypothetical protein ACE361_21965 [Aureliella sp.]